MLLGNVDVEGFNENYRWVFLKNLKKFGNLVTNAYQGIPYDQPKIIEYYLIIKYTWDDTAWYETC